MLFRVKICGVTTADDARLVAEAGADAIGLNFVSGSPRFLDVDQAHRVAAAVPAGILKVGVFAGATAAEIRRVVASVGLDAVQLHGHLDGTGAAVDPPARCAELAGLRVIRAVRVEAGSDPLAAARRWLAEAAALGAAPEAVIIDAAVLLETEAGRLGGTGVTVDWEAVACSRPLGLPTALAGGLTPENVARAIRVSKTQAVDTSSGVESGLGRKNPEKVRAFVAAARTEIPPTASPR